MTTPNNGTKSQPPAVSTTTPTPEVATTPPIQTVPAVTPVDPAPTPAATTPPPSGAAETLMVEVDKPTIKEGVLNSSQPITFRLTPTAGQQLKTTLIGIPAGATMNVLATSPTGVDTVAKGTVNWQGVITTASEYRIEIVPLIGAASSNYRLEVNLIGSPSTATPVAPVAPVVPAPAPVK